MWKRRHLLFKKKTVGTGLQQQRKNRPIGKFFDAYHDDDNQIMCDITSFRFRL
jgi:hypothetical protein